MEKEWIFLLPDSSFFFSSFQIRVFGQLVNSRRSEPTEKQETVVECLLFTDKMR